MVKQYLLSKVGSLITVGVDEEESLQLQKRKRILNTSIVLGLLFIVPSHILIVCLKGEYMALWAELIYIAGIVVYYFLIRRKKNFIYGALVLSVAMLLAFSLASWRAQAQEPSDFMFLLWCLAATAFFPKRYWWKHSLIVIALLLYFVFNFYHRKYLPFSHEHALGQFPVLVCYFLLIRFIENEQEQYQQQILEQQQEMAHQNELLEEQNIAIVQARAQEKQLLKELLEAKDRALATHTLQGLERHQALLPLVKRLSVLAKSLDEPFASEVSAIKRVFQQHLDEKSWNKFLFQFEQVHPRFFAQLKLKHAILTANDLKVCAYLKVGLSNQEIAHAITITPASMKKNLNRLKKKLDLGPNEDLREYIIGLS